MKKNMCRYGLIFILWVVSSCHFDRKGNIVIWGTDWEPKLLYPAKNSETSIIPVSMPMFEGLVKIDSQSMEIIPHLAESFKISQNGLDYSFTLRENVQFHDGTMLNAQAVLFSFLRQHDKNHPYYKKGPWPNWDASGLKNNIANISAIDDKTVKISLYQRDTFMLNKLAMDFASIVSPKAWESYEVGSTSALVGTGSMVFDYWKKSQELGYRKFENYWDKENSAKSDRLIIKFIRDGNIRELSLLKGEVDIINGINPQDVKKLENKDDINIIESDTLYTQFFMMNHLREPFNSPLVRKAISHLINREAIVDILLFGYGSISKNPYPSKMGSYGRNYFQNEFNIKKAKELLKEAGYENGFKMEFLYNKGHSTRKSIGDLIQNDFKKVGIEVEIKVMEWGTVLSQVSSGNYDTVVYARIAPYSEPYDFFLNLFHSKSIQSEPVKNVVRFSNNAFDTLVDQMPLRGSDSVIKQQLYDQAQKILYDEMPAIPLYDGITTIGLNTNLKGFNRLPTGNIDFGRLKMELRSN